MGSLKMIPGVLALIPVSEEARRGIPYTPYPGSVVIKCECGEDCWIGPEQQKKAKEGFPYKCVICIIKAIPPGEAANLNIIKLSDK